MFWVDRERLRANLYNPNHVAPPELALLKRSILQDGWTQPIVIAEGGEIIDGYHRWLLSADPEVAALTGGLVPTVTLRPGLTLQEQMAATVRHNRARGVHGVRKMAPIVQAFLAEQVDAEEELGMEREEVLRLSDLRGSPERLHKTEFGKGWVPSE